MNLIKEVESFLDNKDFDLLTKVRYLYLKSCEYFTYDHRYYYADNNLINEIRNTKIDLENIIDNRVICYSWSEQIYLPLLKLIGIEGKLVDNFGGHGYVIFEIDGKKVKADACISSDLSRVKFKSNTTSFYIGSKYFDQDKIQEIDTNIGYLVNEYSNTSIQRQTIDFEEECKKLLNCPLGLYDDKVLVLKLYKIKEILESFPNVKQFSDCLFLISYIYNKLFSRIDEEKISIISLYNSELPDWDFKYLYQLHLTDDIVHFLLNDAGNGYKFNQITEFEAKEYKRNYSMNRIF